MKPFKTLLLIIITVFLIDKIVFYSLVKIDEKVLSGEGVGKVNHFLKVKDTVNFVVFGSSRANHHIDPLVFGKSSYNVGHGGTKMAFSATLIKTLPKKLKQNIFLNLDPGYVFDISYIGKDINSLKTKYHQNTIIKNEINKINMNNFFSSFFWSLDYNGKILSLLSNRLRPKYNYKRYYGYDPISNTNNQREIFKKRLRLIKENNCKDNYLPSNLELKYLKEIKTFCVENYKELIIFTSPVYIDNCKKDNEALKLLIGDIGFVYYDFSDLFNDYKDLDLWKDENHLSKKGADLFSKLFNEKLKEDGFLK